MAQSPAAAHAPATASVVFVCEHGSVKSLIAASYFNQRAQAKGLKVRAIARGVAPEPTVPPAVLDGLRAAGIDVSEYRPRLLSDADIRGATLIVSFDEDISSAVAGQARYLQWDNLPGVLSDYPRGKTAIVKKVDVLVGELAGAAR
jgi:protein-tyrosine-phosphatase